MLDNLVCCFKTWALDENNGCTNFHQDMAKLSWDEDMAKLSAMKVISVFFWFIKRVSHFLKCLFSYCPLRFVHTTTLVVNCLLN